MIIERMGKAIRVPPRDAMLSHAGQSMGMGWVFGLHEALDQAGAMIGPLIVAAVLYFKGDYQQSFAILLIPALLALAILLFSRYLYPKPQSLEVQKENIKSKAFTPGFWLYLSAASLIAAGYADFPLVAYHFQKTDALSPIWIPVSYSIAMGVNIISAPLLGHLYDRWGFSVLIGTTIISSLFAPLVFLGGFSMIILGISLWSIGFGAHESLMRAIVANMTPQDKRASAYGIFNMSFGIFWFLGSFLMGALYDVSIPLLVVFSITIQLLAVPIMLMAMKKINSL
jgi:MFS family permease